MILKSDALVARITSTEAAHREDPLVFTPAPDLALLRCAGAGSIDLRLGTWFMTLRSSRCGVLDVASAENMQPTESSLTRRHYVGFGNSFILHPRNFVLGVTLEWIRIPGDLAAYVVGRSSWGRRGLVIETAAGVHPGFVGCLTLELFNVGEVPIAVRPGMTICQLFVHQVKTAAQDEGDKSMLIGHRQPRLGKIALDSVAAILAKGPRFGRPNSIQENLKL